MERDRINVGVSRPFGFELCGALKFAKRFFGLLQAGQRQAERMMQAGIPRRCDDRRTQYALSLAIAAELAIKIGEVDRGRRKLRTKPQCGLVLGLRIRSDAAACIEISK